MVAVLLDGVADVERAAGVYVLEVGGHVECDAVDDAAGGVVDELELNVLEVAAHELACAEVLHASGAEGWLAVARAEGVEESEDGDEFGRDVGEGEECVDVDLRCELLGEDVGGDILLEPAREFGNVLLAQREAHGVGVAAEVFEEVAC